MSIPKARIYPYDEAALEQLGEQCSMSERRADEATRDVVNWLKCEFMKDRVGESFPGVITAVTGFGLFVELTDIYVEGLVHVTALPGDYYHFDPVHHRLAGERTGRSFRLGDTVEVRVMRVDLDERKIDFEMSEKQVSAPIGRKRRSTETAPAPAPVEKAAPNKSGRRSATPKAEPVAEAYRPSDAAAKNAEVRKSRELKQALLAEAKGGGKAASGKSDRAGSASSGKPAKPSKHRKGPPKAGSAPAAKSGGVRKPKAKS
jgi:ribonuclease R